MSKPKVLRNVIDKHWHDLFAPEVQKALAADFDLVTPKKTEKLDAEEIARLIVDCEGVLTCWNSVALTPAMVASAAKLKGVVHAAGTVKGMVPPEAWHKGVTVCSQASVLAIAVAEMTLALIFDGLRQISRLDRSLRRHPGDFAAAKMDFNNYGRLVEANIGLISASLVGKETIKLLKPFHPTLRIYDPFLPDAAAKELGVVKVELDELFRTSEIVSVHAPLLPATINMITARHLALLPQYAVFVNTARGAIVNHADLLAELKKGRFHACLDVTDPEPLPADSEFYRLENVTLTPHVAGVNRVMRKLQGRQSYLDMKSILSGGKPSNIVPFDKLATMA